MAYLKLTYTHTERGKNSVYDGTLNDMMPFAFKLLNFEVFLLGSKIKCVHFGQVAYSIQFIIIISD